MSDTKKIDNLIEERPELFDELDSGDLDRETGVQLDTPKWMEKRMNEVKANRVNNKKNTEST